MNYATIVHYSGVPTLKKAPEILSISSVSSTAKNSAIPGGGLIRYGDKQTSGRTTKPNKNNNKFDRFHRRRGSGCPPVPLPVPMAGGLLALGAEAKFKLAQGFF